MRRFRMKITPQMRRVCFGICGLLMFLSLLSLANAESNEDPNILINVEIMDIDQVQGMAIVNIRVGVYNYHFNKTEVIIWIGGGGGVEVNCSNLEPVRMDNWLYKGESNQITWILEGAGEAFPFDSYHLRFNVSEAYSWSDISLQRGTNAQFVGSRAHLLKDVWGSGEYIDKSMNNNEVSFSIERKWQIPFFQILLPVIACYYLLASSLILNPISKLDTRLRIYLSLFLFGPTFLFAIQSFLPYRSTLSIPELLIIHLLVSNAGFAATSIITDSLIPRIKDKDKRKLFERAPDFLAAAFFTQVFFVLLISTVFEKMTLFNLLILIGFQAPLYIAYYVLFFVYYKRRKELRGNSNVLSAR